MEYLSPTQRLFADHPDLVQKAIGQYSAERLLLSDYRHESAGAANRNGACPHPWKPAGAYLHTGAIYDGGALCNANAAADSNPGKSRAGRDRARVPAVQ
jgi:hypothetical protein